VPLLPFIAYQRTPSTTSLAPSTQHERDGQQNKVSCSAAKGTEGEPFGLLHFRFFYL
jgi:hypothetical protein